MDDHSLIPCGMGQRAIRDAAAAGHVDIVRLLLEKPTVDPRTHGDYPLRAACAQGHLAVVEALLTDGRADPTSQNCHALRLAAAYGHVSVVERILSGGRRIPKSGGGCALEAAAHAGHLTVLERLLAHKKLKIDELNGAMCAAANRGHLAIVDRLLVDGRIAPNWERADALLHAIDAGSEAVVLRLLQDERVDASANDQIAVYGAAAHGSAVVMEAVLANPEVDPVEGDALSTAAEEGNSPALKLLLADARVNPVDDAALEKAAINGHSEILQCLLRDERIGAHQLSAALAGAASVGHADILRVLLTDRRPVDIAAKLAALSPAAERGHIDAVECILAACPVELAADGVALSHRDRAAAAAAAALAASVLPLESFADLGSAEGEADDTPRFDGYDSDDAPDPPPELGFRKPPPPTEAQKAFIAAAKAGDAPTLRRLLDDPSLPVVHREPFHYDSLFCKALGKTARIGHTEAAKALLAYPCLLPGRHLERALSTVIQAGHSHIMDMMLADSRLDGWMRSKSVEDLPSTITECVAEGDASPRVLLHLLQDPRVDRAMVGAAITKGLKLGQAEHNGQETRRGGSTKPRADSRKHLQILQFPFILRACLAASPSLPSFICNAIDVAALGARAWRRRRFVVAARARALEADSDAE